METTLGKGNLPYWVANVPDSLNSVDARICVTKKLSD